MSTLDPVQIAALQFSQDKPGVGWFLEQGLGKTLCALAEFQTYVNQNKADRMIVICPNSFKKGWADEVEKHAFKLDVHVFRSAKREDASEFCKREHEGAPVLIVNYEAARIPSVLAGLVKWAQRGKTYLVIDESIQIKGHKSDADQGYSSPRRMVALHQRADRRPLHPHPDWSAPDPGTAGFMGPAPNHRAVSAQQLLCLPRHRSVSWAATW